MLLGDLCKKCFSSALRSTPLRSLDLSFCPAKPELAEWQSMPCQYRRKSLRRTVLTKFPSVHRTPSVCPYHFVLADNANKADHWFVSSYKLSGFELQNTRPQGVRARSLFDRTGIADGFSDTVHCPLLAVLAMLLRVFPQPGPGCTGTIAL